MKSRKAILKTVLSGLFLALAYLLPFLTGSNIQLGKMFCPMHIPVFLCGFICGPAWGAVVGATAPILRSLLVGQPLLLPMAVTMAFELAAYGLISGLLWRLPILKKTAGGLRVAAIYGTLVPAMLTGRLICGAANYFISVAQSTDFSFGIWYAGSIADAIPGIAIQLLLIPAVVMVSMRYERPSSRLCRDDG